jgi:hypothetical protein
MIGSDSTLEVAMELLSAAGIGPEDYVVRASANYKVCTLSVKIGGEMFRFVGRHTPDEYKEFFSCLEAAKHKPEELEEAVPAMMAVAQRWVSISECFGAEEEMNMVGMGITLMAWIMMRAGCAFPEGLKAEVLRMLDVEAENWDEPERNLVRANFKGLVERYSEDPENCVALGYDVMSFEEHMRSSIVGNDERHPLMSAEAIASRNYTHTHERTKESIVNFMRTTKLVGKAADKMHKKMMADPVTSARDPRLDHRGVRACGACKKPEAWHGDQLHGGAKGVKLLTCAGCGQAWYCGVACQRAAWPSHKAACTKNKQRAAELGCVGLPPAQDAEKEEVG